MEVDNGIVRVGVEIEVAAYKSGHNNRSIVQALLDAGYMHGTLDDWKEEHPYRCTCKNGCQAARSGDVYMPPVVSLSYDASLPASGGEWVTSAILLAQSGLQPIKEIWDIIAPKAKWTDQLKNRRGDGRASPSIHLHVSSTEPKEEAGFRWKLRDEPPAALIAAGDGGAMNLKSFDIMHALSLFSPELMALASVCGITRGLSFRQPVRLPSHRGHHGFIHVRDVKDSMVHIEWRMFEAAYDNWEYLESSAFLAAALTRAFQRRDDTLDRLMVGGYANKLNEHVLAEAVSANSTSAFLKLVDGNRFEALRTLCVEELWDEPRGLDLVNNMFNMAAERNL